MVHMAKKSFTPLKSTWRLLVVVSFSNVRVGAAFLEVAQKAAAKLEKVLSLQAMSPIAWFTHIDTYTTATTAGGLGNGRLSVDELQRGLAEMTSGKVHPSQPLKNYLLL